MNVAVEIAGSWCFNIAIHDEDVNQAATEVQGFAQLGRQVGSIIDPGRATTVHGLGLRWSAYGKAFDH